MVLLALILSLAPRVPGGIQAPAYAQDSGLPEDTPVDDTSPDPASTAAPLAPDFGTPAKRRPVLFIHGIDGIDLLWDDAGVNCSDTWRKMKDKFHLLGWDPDYQYGSRFRFLSYYHGDSNCSDHWNSAHTQNNTIEHHGKHDTHNGSTSSNGNGHASGGSNDMSHDNDAWLQHLAYHLAWYIYDHYTSKGIIVTVVAHSQGGLLINYALLKAQHDQADFPKVLYVGQVLTMGTAHTGATRPCKEPYQFVFQAAQQCWDPGVEKARSFLPWLAQYGTNPQGSQQFETEWTLMGSWYDEWVHWNSTIGHPIHSRPSRGWDWWRYPEHWVRQYESTGSPPAPIEQLKHGSYRDDISDVVDRNVLWQHKGGQTQSDRSMGHAVRWADSALSTTNW